MFVYDADKMVFFVSMYDINICGCDDDDVCGMETQDDWVVSGL
jgi:hypothetical protein